AGGRIDLGSDLDPALTGTRVEYIRRGIDAEGVMRALLECWTLGDEGWLEALKERVADPPAGSTGKHQAAQALCRLALAPPQPPRGLQGWESLAKRTATADPVARRPADLERHIPQIHRAELFPFFAKSDEMTQRASYFVSLSLYQAWLKWDAEKC